MNCGVLDRRRRLSLEGSDSEALHAKRERDEASSVR